MEQSNIVISAMDVKPADIKNYSKVRKRKQGFDKLDIMPIKDFLNNPVLFCRAHLTFKEQNVFNELLRLSNKYEKIYATQDTIAAAANGARPWVTKTIKRFELLGFLITNYRHKLSCEYKISSYFFDLENRKKLAPFFPALDEERNPVSQ